MMVRPLKMPIEFGGFETKGRTLEAMVHLKTSMVEVKAEEKCLVHALIFSMVRLSTDPNYKAYIQGRNIRHVVEILLVTTGIYLSAGGGIPKLMKLQENFKEYRIVAFGGLNCEDIVFDGQVESEKRINLLYDSVSKHYHVINNLTGAMKRRHVCRVVTKGV